jgi:hypothetical protein
MMKEPRTNFEDIHCRLTRIYYRETTGCGEIHFLVVGPPHFLLPQSLLPSIGLLKTIFEGMGRNQFQFPNNVTIFLNIVKGGNQSSMVNFVATIIKRDDGEAAISPQAPWI